MPRTNARPSGLIAPENGSSLPSAPHSSSLFARFSKVVELLCEGGACLPEGPLLAPFWQRLEGHVHEPQLAIPHLPCPDGDEVVIKSKAKEVAGSDKAAARAVRQPTPLQKKQGWGIC
jgi:hypothetical protein